MGSSEQRLTVRRQNAEILSDTRLPGPQTLVHGADPRVSSLELRESLPGVLAQMGFLNVQIDPNADFAVALVQDSGPPGPLNLSSKRKIQIAWRAHPTDTYQTYIEWAVINETRRVLDERAADTFGSILSRRALQIEQERRLRPTKIVVGPGERLEDSDVRKLKDLDPNKFFDHSGFATPDLTAGLRRGSLPLGRYLEFGKRSDVVNASAQLTAGEMLRVGGPGLRDLSIFVHGEANAGKTTFAAHAIEAANSIGYQVVVIDADGTLIEACRDRLGGDVRMVSIAGTVGFLPRADVPLRDAERSIEQIVDILLAREDLRRADASAAQSGEWLRGIVMLQRISCTLPQGRPELEEILALLSNENQLVSMIQSVDKRVSGDRILRAQVEGLESQLSNLIAPNKLDWGRRDANLPFAHLTSPMRRAIQPFLDRATRPLTYLEMLNDRSQASILVQAPGHDRQVQATGMALLENRLTAVLAARSGVESRRAMLIVVDGIERLGGFDPLRLVDLARGTNASCLFTTSVLRREGESGGSLYSRMSVQVYLTPESDEVVQALNAQLGRRDRQSIDLDSGSADRRVRLSWKLNSEYFGKRDLTYFPGATRPAILFAPRLGARLPVLADQDA
jgi:hypothetical protein